MTALLDQASENQRRAADPAASAWVAASAGSGKTKVLSDRVLALLLTGTPAHKILCLTFTKAAAAEMANRIAARLGRWAIARDAELEQDIARLLGRPADEAMQVRARQLFAAVQDCPGGMHIETIHAFCQSLLRRFPLEAGIAPHFQVMDERDAGELLEAAKEQVLSRARDGDDAPLARALAEITGAIHESFFPELMAEIAAERGRIRRLVANAGGIDGAVTTTRQALGLDAFEDEETILAKACDESSFDAPACRQAARTLMEGSDQDAGHGQMIADWLEDVGARPAGFSAYAQVFLTKDGTIRKKLCTKAVADRAGDILAAEALRVLEVTDRLKAAAIARASRAVLVLGHALLAAYERAKAARALMDYDDLILAARALLEGPNAVAWVLYKLDGGIDHVLIDEAQDTNPDQWAIVEAIAFEFFAGQGARTASRTLFAVGDAKQSIYSFQRADPLAFRTMRANFGAQAKAAGQRWENVDLAISFRSVPAVLDAVDAVFAGPGPGGEGVVEPGSDARHLAARTNQAGLVELWPPVMPKALEEPPAWKPPVERIGAISPRTRLARLVAKRIRLMIDSETLTSKNRPVRAGDVMVLLRRRGGFVADLVRALKEQDVPVAGADRMVLTAQMAVMDLMALGQFLLLPEDDLTLASLLKSPLFALDEEQLFRLAHERGRDSLWDSLKRRQADEPAFGLAFSRLAELLGLTDRLTPHALFSHVLDAMGGRRKLVQRLGPDALDPIDEFIALCLAFERSHPPSLQGFLRWLETGGVEIKRDLDQGGTDAVRIMTVHGSKGLQAPIVFLPDTMQIPTKGARLLWVEDAPLWSPSKETADPVCRKAREAETEARLKEYRRLFYVAMTRAEDRLYLCGWQTRKAAPDSCWYALARAALNPLAREDEDPFLAQAGETEGALVLRLDSLQKEPLPPRPSVTEERIAPVLPEWAAKAAPDEPSPPRPLAPSRPEGDEPAAASPLAPPGDIGRFRRGTIIHRLLQTLPDIKPSDRAATAMRHLGRVLHDQPAALRHAIAAEVLAVLDHPRFAPLFAPGSRAEVPLAGLVGDGRAISGVVDRLAVTDTEVLIADFKTNRRPPTDPADIPSLYLRQMAAYRLALACIYPGRIIRTILVWTDGPSLMEIDPRRLDDLL